MPCGRCRQLLWENGGPDCLLLTPEGVLPMREVLPQAFGPDNLSIAGPAPPDRSPAPRLTPTVARRSVPSAARFDVVVAT